MNKKRIEFHSIFIFLLSLFTPIFINHRSLGIYNSIFLALDSWDKEHLIIAFFKLVFLNTIRVIPIFIFMFIFFQSFLDFNSSKKQKIIIFLTTFIIPGIMYKILNLFFNLSLTIGNSYFLSIIWLAFYIYSNPFYLKAFEKYLILLLFLIGIQWLDILHVFSFFKIGEITLELKKVTEFMNAQNIITILAISFFILFTSISILLLYFFRRNDLYRKEFELKIENRYLKEIQFLVHDLKTPLFSINALIELLEIKGNEEDLVYFSRIKSTLNKTNIFINNLLYIEDNSFFLLNDFIKFVLSFLSSNKKSNIITTENYFSSNTKIFGNKITLARVFINIITNSLEANSTKIKITTKEYPKFILFCIQDNGVGIQKKNLKKIFSESISTKNSSGLGLIFVQKIIKNVQGKIFIVSNHKGAKVYIKLKKEKH